MRNKNVDVSGLLASIDGYGRPFTSTDIAERMGITDKNDLKNLSSMLGHFYTRCIIERIGKRGHSYLYMVSPGSSATVLHSQWRYRTLATAHETQIAIRDERMPPASGFPLGQVRLSANPNRFFAA